MQVEQLDSFRNPFGSSYLPFLREGLMGPRPPAGVRDELAIRIVDRDADPPGHDALLAVAEAEPLDGRCRDAPLGEVWMRRIELQLEPQRLVWLGLESLDRSSSARPGRQEVCFSTEAGPLSKSNQVSELTPQFGWEGGSRSAPIGTPGERLFPA